MSAFGKLGHSLQKHRNLATARKTLRLRPKPLSFYCGLMETGTPFSFVRFGDGEWSAILGRQGANCDGHEYFPELGRRLANALKAQSGYFYGLQYYTLKMDGPAVIDYLHRNNIAIPFHNADVFAFANVLGRLNPFIEALRKKPVAVIGPAHLRGLLSVFPMARFFEVPSSNCFIKADTITREILEWGSGRLGVVYSFSASMAANVMIHDLWPSLGKNNWLLDLGSLWDVYVGVKSRGWFKELNLKPACDRNLGVQPKGISRNVHDNLVLFLNRFHVKT